MSNGGTPTPLEGPGKSPAGTGWILSLSFVLLGMMVAVFYLLIQLWPHPTPSTRPPLRTTVQQAPAAAVDTTARDTTRRSDSLGLALDTARGRDTTRSAVPGSPGPVAGGTRPPSENGGPDGPPGAGVDAADACRSMLQAEWTDTAKVAPAGCVTILGREVLMWDEQRLLLLVMLGGALGGLLHGIRSLGWYVGNRRLVKSWLLRYLSLGFTGAGLAFVFYVVVRGGFFSPDTSFEATSPFGFVAFATLVGLFSEQAILKLKKVAETVFTEQEEGKDARPEDTPSQPPAPGGGRAGAPAITGVKPHEVGGVASGAFVVAGSGFDPAAEVWVGGAKQQSTRVSATELRFTSAQAPTAGTTLTVEVRNPDGRKATFDAKI